jgi:hypothetical protein
LQEFITKNFGTIFTIVCGICAWVVTLGVMVFRINVIEKQIESMNNNGTSHSRESITILKEKVGNQEQRLGYNENNTEHLVKQLNEMSSDIKVIKMLMEERKN